MILPITGLYIGLTIIIVIVLAVRIGIYRVKENISISHGGNVEVETRIRAHGNLTETAALTILAIAILEANGVGPIMLHGLGIAYIIGRILHPIGLRHNNIKNPARAIGSLLSTLVMLVAGIYSIILSIPFLFGV